MPFGWRQLRNLPAEGATIAARLADLTRPKVGLPGVVVNLAMQPGVAKGTFSRDS